MDKNEAEHLLKSRVEFSPPPEGSNMARELLNSLKKHSSRTLLVDAQTGCKLTGANVLQRSGVIATGLVRSLGLKPNDVVMNLCERGVTEALVALGALFAGGALYPAIAADGYKEIEVLCELISPQVIIASQNFCESAKKLREDVPGCRGMKIVLDDGQYNHEHYDNKQQLTSNTSGHLKSKVLYDENNNEIVQDEIYSLIELEMANEYDALLIESIVHKQIVPSEHVATYMLTSGSTGQPKVVPATHEEIVYGLYGMLSAAQNPFPRQQLPTVDENNNKRTEHDLQPDYLMPLTQDDVVSGDLPLDHGAGINVMFLSLCIGSKFIVMPSFDVDIFWHFASEHKVTFSLSSTSFGYNLFTHLKKLIDTGATRRYDLSSFRLIGVCGAKMTYADLVYEVLAHESYAHIQVCQAYGCTENGFIAIGLGREGRVGEYFESTGYLFPGLVAKVVDYAQQERVVPCGQRGELLVWSQSLFKRYIISDKEQTSAASIFAKCHDQKGVFYRTGDQAHLDAAGRIYLHGRFKDTLVLMGDWKVMPAELEAILNEHPLIETSVVVGMPDREVPGCHAPKAFVKLISRELARKQKQQQQQQQQEGDGKQQRVDLEQTTARMLTGDLDYVSEQIYNFFAERTAREKHLRGGVRILDEFPRVGLLKKIDRKALLLMD